MKKTLIRLEIDTAPDNELDGAAPEKNGAVPEKNGALPASNMASLGSNMAVPGKNRPLANSPPISGVYRELQGEYRYHTPHSCRHTFSRLCESYGVSEADRKRMLGHSFGNDITNGVYGHRSVEELRAEIEKIKGPEM